MVGYVGSDVFFPLPDTPIGRMDWNILTLGKTLTMCCIPWLAWWPIFVVCDTGNDPTNPAHYHPFYITDSSEGGFGQKAEKDQRRQRVFAGVSYDSEGYPYPTAGELQALQCFYFIFTSNGMEIWIKFLHYLYSTYPYPYPILFVPRTTFNN